MTVKSAISVKQSLMYGGQIFHGKVHVRVIHHRAVLIRHPSGVIRIDLPDSEIFLATVCGDADHLPEFKAGGQEGIARMAERPEAQGKKKNSASSASSAASAAKSEYPVCMFGPGGNYRRPYNPS